MKRPIQNKTLFLLASALSMLLGGIIYLLWRPQTLVMFSWCKKLGVYGIVQQMRVALDFLKDILPVWFIYSLPQALWCFSGLCCIHAIWNRKAGERFWIAVVFLFCLSVEVLQMFHVVSGSFDTVDLLFIIVFYCLFELLIFQGENHEKI